MITLLIIIGYIASVFLCRWLDKMATYNADRYEWILWIIPGINILFAISFLVLIIKDQFLPWFRGDNW